MKKLSVISALLVICALAANAGDHKYKTITNIDYRPDSVGNAYLKERCVLDIYYPEDIENYPTVVWFHGGGLSGGDKKIPSQLKDKGLGVVAVRYRLCNNEQDSTVTTVECVDDAAAAAAWVYKHIAEYGGDPSRIYLSGHSAGGYQVMMIGFDKTRLAKYGVDADVFKALIPFSGQAITHYQNRRDRGIPDLQPIIDTEAPLYHARGNCPPTLLICGDRTRELFGRYEENAYLWRMMKLLEHRDVEILELDGFDHGGMAKPAHLILLEYIKNKEKPQ